MSGSIAIVGRPNVGKSALFNRIVGRRIAIVHDEPGVTRDRITAEAEWRGHAFTLVDTGGIGLLKGERSDDVLTRAAFEQVQIAIESAQVVVLVVNVQEGLVPLDREVAARLRRAGKPVIVAANKTDTEEIEPGSVDFTQLGFGKIVPVSALHNRGVEVLLDAAVALLPGTGTAEPSPLPSPIPQALTEHRPPVDETGERPAASGLKLAIVGRPNVGKSSIINTLTQSERVIVSPIPGTTRDSIDVPFEVISPEGVRQHYVLIDTAGMRKKRRVDDSIEFFSVKRAEDSVARCDIVVLVLDAEMGITEQDKKIGDVIVEHKKACIVVVNKWDLVEDSVRKAREEEISRRKRQHGRSQQMTTLGEFGAWVQERLFFLDYAPVIFASAKTGFNLDRLLEAVRYVAAQLTQQVPTAILNRVLNDAIERRQPISDQGHFLKFFYATQTQQAPPTFLLFVNRKELFSPAYEKYLAGVMRQAFGYEGCPIQLVPKARPQSIEPVRSGRREAPQRGRRDGPPRSRRDGQPKGRRRGRQK